MINLVLTLFLVAAVKLKFLRIFAPKPGEFQRPRNAQ